MVFSASDFFFFSSRRRHTRYWRDWSSDVCSSDLQGTMSSVTSAARPRVRMTGAQRRQQLLDIGRELFGQKGYEATSIEEVAARADVSKPVVYEHFGGKEGLYAVVVDREMQLLLDRFAAALSSPGSPRELLERAALVLLDYIEDDTDGFRVLTRDSPVTSGTGTFSSLIGEVARRV